MIAAFGYNVRHEHVCHGVDDRYVPSRTPQRRELPLGYSNSTALITTSYQN